MDDSVIQVLVLAAVAVFLVLRLKSILGTREGFEKPLVEDEPEIHRANRSFEVIDGGPDHDIIDNLPEGSTALEPLSAMKRVEPEFSVTKFLSGARGAYEMILVAFDKGEMERIRPFLAPEVFEAFNGVVEQRAAQGFLLALGLLRPQVPERRNDRGQKHQHRRQRGECCKPVLPGGRQAAPPLAPPTEKD